MDFRVITLMVVRILFGRNESKVKGHFTVCLAQDVSQCESSCNDPTMPFAWEENWCDGSGVLAAGALATAARRVSAVDLHDSARGLLVSCGS